MELIKEEHSVAEDSNILLQIQQQDKGDDNMAINSAEKGGFNDLDSQHDKLLGTNEDKQTGNQK